MASARLDPIWKRKPRFVWGGFALLVAIIIAVGAWLLWPKGEKKELVAQAPPAAVAPKPKAPPPKGMTTAEKARVQAAAPTVTPSVPPPPAPPVATAPKPSRPQIVRTPIVRAPASRPQARTTDPCAPVRTGFDWRVSGGDPYARSEEEAFSDAKLDRMLYCFKVPKEHWAEVKRQLRNTDNGRTIRLGAGDVIDKMMFGGGKMLAQVRVKIPGGQRALGFTVVVDGVTYKFILPLGCWNWSLIVIDDCVVIEFNHNRYQGGRVYWGAEQGPLPDDPCNAMSQGNGRWTAWTRICTDCRVTAYESRNFATTARRQRLRFSKAVWQNGIRVCLEARDHAQTCYISVPGPGRQWGGRTHIMIPDNLWRECRPPDPS